MALCEIHCWLKKDTSGHPLSEVSGSAHNNCVLDNIASAANAGRIFVLSKI